MLSNAHHKMFIHVDGKQFEVKHICRSDGSANTFIAINPSTAIIDTDIFGNIYIAEVEPVIH